MLVSKYLGASCMYDANGDGQLSRETTWNLSRKTLMQLKTKYTEIPYGKCKKKIFWKLEEAFDMGGMEGDGESMERIQGKMSSAAELELVCTGIQQERKLENIWCRTIMASDANQEI